MTTIEPLTAERPVSVAAAPAPYATATADGLAALWRARGVLLALLDLLTVLGSFMLAYYLRFHLEFLALKSIPTEDVDTYLKGAVLLAVIWAFLIWRDRGYDAGLSGIAAPMLRVRSLLLSSGYALGTLMVVSYLYREMLLSRQVYLMTGALALGTMVLTRMLFRAVDRDLAAQHAVLQRLVVCGTSRRAREFIKRVRAQHGVFHVAGVLTAGDGDAPRDHFAGRPVLGGLDELCDVHARQPFDTLVLAEALPTGEAARDAMLRIVNFCEMTGIALYTLPGSLDVAVSQREVGSFSGMPVIRLQDASCHRGYAVVKRLLDVAVAAPAVLLGLPLWLATAALIKLTSKGPVFFVQQRAGLHGRPFRIYKFRTMVVDAEQRLREVVDLDALKVPGFKVRNDPRVTPAGRFLRRTSIDELPQLLNVLRGEMSLVGPRPEMLHRVDRYTPEQRRRLKAKPGITGYQQVAARGIPLASGIKYDLVYLKHQSLLLDLYILLRTVVVLVRGSGITH